MPGWLTAEPLVACTGPEEEAVLLSKGAPSNHNVAVCPTGLGPVTSRLACFCGQLADGTDLSPFFPVVTWQVEWGLTLLLQILC